MDPQILPINVPIKEGKIVAVAKLLEAHRAENWRLNEGFEFYTDVGIQDAPEENAALKIRRLSVS